MIRLLRRRRTSRLKLFHSPLNPFFFVLVVFLRSDEFSTFRQNNKMGCGGRERVLKFTLHFLVQTFSLIPTFFLLFVSPFQSRNQNTPSRCFAKARKAHRMALEFHHRASHRSRWASVDSGQSHPKLPSEESHRWGNAQRAQRDEHIQAWIECDKSASR